MRFAEMAGQARAGCAIGLLAVGLLALLPAQPLRAAEARLPARGGPPRGPIGLHLTVDVPEPDSVIGDSSGLVFVSGEALAHYGEFHAHDLVFAIDTSESTSTPSGTDVNGDGRVSHGEPVKEGFLGGLLDTGQKPTDLSDSILAGEIAAVGAAVDRLDPRTTRVGIIRFSGLPDSRDPHAETLVPLTSNYSDVRQGLGELLASGASGHTDILAGIQLAIAELTAAKTAASAPRDNVQRVLMLLTDGISTLPVEGAVPYNRGLVIEEGRKAAHVHIRIDAFSIGTAQHDPITAQGLARATGGTSATLHQASDLAAKLEAVTFAEVAELRVMNLTRAQPAAYVSHQDNGRFSALLQLTEGENVLQVYARATDGSEATRSLRLRLASGKDPQQLPIQLESERTRLMGRWLGQLKQKGDALQADRDAKLLRTLQKQIEDERAKASQRRNLEIQTDPVPPPAAP